MNRRFVAAMMAIAAVSGCTSEATIDEPASEPTTTTETTEADPVPTSTSATAVTTSTVVTPSSTARAEEGVPTSSDRSTSTSRSTITTDAGRIEAEYRDGELDVDVDSESGWVVEVQRRSPNEIDVVWTMGDAIVRATVVAGDNGISTTTRSVTSSS